MNSIMRLGYVAILAACALQAGNTLAQSDSGVWAEDCVRGPAPDQKRCELVYKLHGPIEGRDHLVALGVTVTSGDGRLVWIAIQGLKPRSAGIIVDKSPVLFSFNCSEEYCFFRENTDLILRQMHVGQAAIVRITSPSWEQHDFVFLLRGFTSLYEKAQETMVGPNVNGCARRD